VKLVLTGIGFLLLAIAVFVCLAMYYPGRRASSPNMSQPIVSSDNHLTLRSPLSALTTT
jgi:hypothetical protein